VCGMDLHAGETGLRSDPCGGRELSDDLSDLKVGQRPSPSFRDKSILVLGGMGRLSAELG
jgi:hypothetical protein